jgi:hypothetical protein
MHTGLYPPRVRAPCGGARGGHRVRDSWWIRLAQTNTSGVSAERRYEVTVQGQEAGSQSAECRQPDNGRLRQFRGRAGNGGPESKVGPGQGAGAPGALNAQSFGTQPLPGM